MTAPPPPPTNQPPNRPSKPPSNAQPNATKPPDDPRWYFRLIGFDLSCAGVTLGAAVAAAGYMWFGSVTALVVGIVLTAVCTVTCFTNLSAIRR